jgi:hypothetical protein
VPEIPGHPAEAPLSALPARPALGILADDRVCLWCNDSFEPRRSGGKQQAFCRPACRRAFDVAGRRWVAEAIAAGVLTVDALKSGPASTRALGAAVASAAPVSEAAPQRPVRVAERAESGDARQRNFEQLLARTIVARRRG